MSVDVNGGVWLTHPLLWVLAPVFVLAGVAWLCRDVLIDIARDLLGVRERRRAERELERLGHLKMSSFERRLRG